MVQPGQSPASLDRCAVLADGKRVTGDRRLLQRTSRFFKPTQVVDRAHLRPGALPRRPVRYGAYGGQVDYLGMHGVLRSIFVRHSRLQPLGSYSSFTGFLGSLGSFNPQALAPGLLRICLGPLCRPPGRLALGTCGPWHLARCTPVLATCSHPVKRICSAWFG